MPIFPANGDVEMRVDDALLFDFEEEVAEEVLADEGDHDVPFDVTEVPQQLEAVDGHHQADVNVSLYENDGAYGQDHVDKFKASAVKAIRLSTLRYMHENKRAMSAISLLKRRHRLEVDGEYVVNIHGANVVARVAPHYLDFVLYVGSRRGLDAALPNVDVDHTWSAKLKLNLGYRQWPESRQGALGFDPKGRMMYVGNRLEEQLWIAMLPNEYLEGAELRRVVEMEGTGRAVSTQHSICAGRDAARRHCVHHAIPGAIDAGEYQIVYGNSTCVFAQDGSGRFNENNREIMLRLNNMRELHRQFMNLWERWVNGAPASWKRDGFLTDNSPVGVCMLYGQNQPIMVATAMEEEKRNWDRDRNYRHISHMSFSLATHLSYLDVQEWEDIHIRVIEQNNGVDVRELELVDEEGFEINVYNEAGYRVPRRRPREFRTCGVMLDLERVHKLFKGQEEEGGEFCVIGEQIYNNATLLHTNCDDITMYPSLKQVQSGYKPVRGWDRKQGRYYASSLGQRKIDILIPMSSGTTMQDTERPHTKMSRI
ncbi:hypothetical protein EDD15DRAFT_2204624 [Pisolithus albus]|nr:hypothetical protein EDD15DRAFT_2204624 [Pisolithus albus]